MRFIFAAMLAAIISALGSAAATATPQPVHVRVEGKYSTLFDGTVLTDGHPVRGSSDSETRTCDTTNLGNTPTAQPSATASAVDAMATQGESFDGSWYDGYDDYFVTRFGPDHDSDALGEWWGVLVDWQFTSVGGCQAPALPADNVLWVYDAFGGKPFLKLKAPSPTPAVVGQPYSVTVVDRETGSDTEASGGGETPAPGATVSAVDAIGHPAGAGTATPGESGGDGSATVTFHQTGWQRLKARETNTDAGSADHLENVAIPSNSIDVCVVAQAGDTCPGSPPSQIALVPDDTPPVINIASPAAGSTTGLSATILDFTATDDYGLAPTCDQTSGSSVNLTAGENTLTVNCEDVFGNASAASVKVIYSPGGAGEPETANPPSNGSAPVPAWTAATSLGKCSKHCKTVRSKSATGGKLMRISSGGSVRLTLDAGKPSLRFAARAKKANISVRIGSRSRSYTLAKGKKPKTIALWSRSKHGWITVTVKSGSADLDAVLLEN
ncbi:MAG: hypothetical protein QM648_10720 [Solirubrobacterales bacterium]